MTEVKSDPLPTPKQREQLCAMMHRAFVELRALGREGRSEQVEDLADAFHNLPTEMYGVGLFRWELSRGLLDEYHKKWRTHGVYDYVHLLDEARKSS
jgi:hypothetical protein